MMINVKKLSYGKYLGRFLPKYFSTNRGKIVAYKIINTDKIRIINKKTYIEIIGQDTSHINIALGLLIKNGIKSMEVDVPDFDFRGVMLDVSRSAVLKIDFLKEILVKLSLFGLNNLGLYMEDIFLIEGEPLIGFARGAYSKEEIRELEDFANELGINIFPCFQTLGHLEQILKYVKYIKYRDTKRVINVTKSESYEFLEKIILGVASYFKNQYIHIGMDEPWLLGRGIAFKYNTPINPPEMYIEHLKKITSIIKKSGKIPIIWGDFILDHKDLDIINEVPSEYIIDYWDYESTETSYYQSKINILKEKKFDIIISPGAHNWNRFFGNTQRAYETNLPFIEAAKKENIKKGMLTLWGNDGNESFVESSLPIIELFLKNTLSKKLETEIDYDFIKKIFNISKEEFDLYNRIENPEISKTISGFIPDAKMLLYDDPLLAMISRHIKDLSVTQYYGNIAKHLSQLKYSQNSLSKLAYYYSDLISYKFYIIHTVLECYLNKDKSGLIEIYKQILVLERKINKFYREFKRNWDRRRKPFGFEVFTNRIGTIMLRTKQLKERLKDYIDGKIDIIDEFELKDIPDLDKSDFTYYQQIYSKLFLIFL